MKERVWTHFGLNNLPGVGGAGFIKRGDLRGNYTLWFSGKDVRTLACSHFFKST